MTLPLGANAAQVYPRLKDFQRTTVDYAFRRMYKDEDLTTRFLVADEVGLGKTMVARGLIARVLDELEGKIDRIDIIYVCSNSAIARQNVNKLAMKDAGDVVLSSRITLLPLEAHKLSGSRVNLVSFTPATSFDLRSSFGLSKERVLLYHLLDDAWGLKSVDARAVLRGGVSKENFRDRIRSFGEERIDRQLAAAFTTELSKQPSLRTEFELLGSEIRLSTSSRLSPDLNVRRHKLIGNLRDLLAKTCLRALEPDLIILDEFQRFKHLLGTDEETENEEVTLAKELFEYVDKANNRARVLLLSATPYKMFTESDDPNGEDHYQDFIATVRFLQQSEVRTSATEALLEEYRKEWLRMDPGFEERIRNLKLALEQELKRVMVRTERLAVTPDRDGMLASVPCSGIGIEPNEALGYRHLGGIAESLDNHDPIEYWKSAPYLLSFMEDYEFKRAITDALADPEQAHKVTALIDQGLPMLLPWREIERYGKIDPSNARMRWLLDRVVESGAWKLLWVPPSHPAYQLAGPFAEPGVSGFTKFLVFSGWKVVPKAIALMVSYEAERRMMDLGGNLENTLEARKRFSPPLRVDQETLFALTYPSFSLASLATDVLTESGTKTLTPEQVLERITTRLSTTLAQFSKPAEASLPDPRWYWAAPALLDWKANPEAAEAWFRQEGLADVWTDQEDEAEAHGVEQMRLQVLYGLAKDGGKGLGAQPEDLARVLGLIALAGPATASLGALAETLDGKGRLSEPSLRNSATRIGWAFRAYFNLPEVVQLLRGLGQDVPYWQLVLRYSLDGGIGAVLAEYFHVLNDWLGLNDSDLSKAAKEIGDKAAEALGIRTANLATDHFVPGPNGTMVREVRRLRSRFAARLAEEKGDDEKVVNRIDQVRTAFNSPFWPFVLATTSVGQEGLDFHLYCHAVVHWNLPSNPVDLEQREGRVHRYKGHAVRKNVARRHGGERKGESPPSWAGMFGAAEATRPPEGSEIWPFWVYPVEGGAKIERHVPALPLSRDVARLERVRRMGALYRMVFGQMRQEDLLGVLAVVENRDCANLLINLCP